MKHEFGKWYPATEVPDEEAFGCIALCISGKSGNITYDHAVILDECNEYCDGMWYPFGCAPEGKVVHGWYMVPEMQIEAMTGDQSCRTCAYPKCENRGNRDDHVCARYKGKGW